MLGAIVGDAIGSRFERINCKHKEFEWMHPDCKLTDDSVMTLAVADAYMNKQSYVLTLREYGQENPTAGYGGKFIEWLDSPNPQPYNSWANGSAMRVSALAWLIDDMGTLMEEAKKSAEVTHNHPEGIKGAQAIAAAILLARQKHTKAEIRNYIEENFGYNMRRTVESIRPTYEFDVSCAGSVPEAIIAFLDSTTFEDCLRNAISLGGDSDTIASMACAIAEAHYGHIPDEMEKFALQFIKQNPRYVRTFNQFCDEYLDDEKDHQ